MPGDATTRTAPTAGPRARAVGRSMTDSPALSAAASRKHLERVQGTLYRETKPSSGGSPVWRPRSASVSWDKEGPSLPVNYHKTSDVEIAVNTPPQTKTRSSLSGWMSSTPTSEASSSRRRNSTHAQQPLPVTAAAPASAEKPTPIPSAAEDNASSPPVPPLNLQPSNGAPPASLAPSAVPPQMPANVSPPPPEAAVYAPPVAPMYYPVPPHMQVDFQQFFESLNPQQQAQYMQQQAMYMASVNAAYTGGKQEDNTSPQHLSHAMGGMSLDGAPRGYPPNNAGPMNHYSMAPPASPYGAPPPNMWQQAQGMYMSPPQSPMAPHDGQPMYAQRGPGNGAGNGRINAHAGNGNGPQGHNGGMRRHGGRGKHQGHNNNPATTTTGNNNMMSMDVAPPHVTVDNMVCWEVRFKAGRTDVYCTTTDAPGELVQMDYVMVEADRGKDMGVLVEQVPCDNYINDPDILKRRILRRAQPGEVSQVADKAMEEAKALEACRAKVAEHKLPMEVAEAEYQFDRRKLTFYFTAEGRIDFRILVRDLFKLFKTRIWLKQLSSPEPTPKSATTPPTASPADTPKKSATPPPVAH